ncbi:ubox domain containing protein [Lichtheimia corymbifera JMRC:FSU:9682]|uniref:Ubox domain containing protein n=1 Tax=Lichtheimia corymbifera JMRC:FSU:9682 TaxID=1263082 RepID=A0A068S3K0_9FUNG|nr:ubox domain containing protein [Lichtheimia corymbifera JMRC:FSU:9682]
MAARNSKSQQSSGPSSTNGDDKQQQQQQQQLQLKTRFFSEVDNRNGSVHCTLQVTHVHWMAVKYPDDIKPVAIGERLRQRASQQESKDELDGSNDDSSHEDSDSPALESDNDLEIIRKENFFKEELTEEERDLVAKRVLMHQKLVKKHERREKRRKSKKIRIMFDYVNDEEIDEMLNDCKGDEDEVICRLAQQVGYLNTIRKQVAMKYPQENTQASGMTMSAEQKQAYQQLVKKRAETLRKTATDRAKKQYRMGSRLCLDEAVKQAQQHQKVDPEKAFEGWSEARIYAYRMIDENPNSYYYRFNAPGEVQRRGQWSKEEKKLFFDRLAEIGANGQWGIFSMKIPGRVGYQCSNFYRLLLETKQITDPNYVLDENGKARYLFDKKDASGKVHKAFRTHRPTVIEEDNNNGSSSGKRRRATTRSSSSSAAAASSATTNDSTTTATNAQQQRSGRRRRRRFAASDESDDDDDDGGAYVDGEYRSSRSRAKMVDTTQSNDGDNVGRRRSKRQRKPTAAAIEAGLVAESRPSCSWETSITGTTQEQQGTQSKDNDDESTINNNEQNPLPGFIDPITLTEVVKPAISKYGHVMGYDSWVRCLTRWEGKQNICPLTKKPLTKRDLVILDFDNIEEYRSRIVNL